jgi:hypothetical protein
MGLRVYRKTPDTTSELASWGCKGLTVVLARRKDQTPDNITDKAQQAIRTTMTVGRVIGAIEIRLANANIITPNNNMTNGGGIFSSRFIVFSLKVKETA